MTWIIHFLLILCIIGWGWIDTIHAQSYNCTRCTWLSQGPSAVDVGTDVLQPVGHGAVSRIRRGKDGITYIGTVNGGVWRTSDLFGAPFPMWSPTTDKMPCNSISSLYSTSTTLLASCGANSAYLSYSGDWYGVMISRDDGMTWNLTGFPYGWHVRDVYKNDAVIIVTANGRRVGNIAMTPSYPQPSDPVGGIWISTDDGRTFTQTYRSSAHRILSDPSIPNLLFATIASSRYVIRSRDNGVTWQDSGIGIDFNQRCGGGVENPLISSSQGIIWVGMSLGECYAFYISQDGGASWTYVPPPSYSLGNQGYIHFAILADPGQPTTLYVGGTAYAYFRLDYVNGNATWTCLTSFCSTSPVRSNPHADCRDLVWDNTTSSLLAATDGGIYRRAMPRVNGAIINDWISFNGNLVNTEMLSVGYDSRTNVYMGGAQDNSFLISRVDTNGKPTTYAALCSGDGQYMGIDTRQAPSVLYGSCQNLFPLFRQAITSNIATNTKPNTFVDFSVIPNINFAFNAKIVMNRVNGRDIMVCSSHANITNGPRATCYNITFTPTIPSRSLVTTLLIAGPYDHYRWGGIKDAIAYENIIVAINSTYITFVDGMKKRMDRMLPWDGGIRSFEMDQRNYMNVIVVASNGHVMRSMDVGMTWYDITGTLLLISPVLMTWGIAIIPYQSKSAIVVGTAQGIYMAWDDQPTTNPAGWCWYRIADGLPNVLVSSFFYDPTDDILVTGTLGRGIWSLSGFSSNVLRSIATTGSCPLPTTTIIPPSVTPTGTSPSSTSSSTKLVIGVVVAFIVVTIVSFTAACFLRRRRQHAAETEERMAADMTGIDVEVDPSRAPAKGTTTSPKSKPKQVKATKPIKADKTTKPVKPAKSTKAAKAAATIAARNTMESTTVTQPTVVVSTATTAQNGSVSANDDDTTERVRTIKKGVPMTPLSSIIDAPMSTSLTRAPLGSIPALQERDSTSSARAPKGSISSTSSSIAELQSTHPTNARTSPSPHILPSRPFMRSPSPAEKLAANSTSSLNSVKNTGNSTSTLMMTTNKSYTTANAELAAIFAEPGSPRSMRPVSPPLGSIRPASPPPASVAAMALSTSPRSKSPPPVPVVDTTLTDTTSVTPTTPASPRRRAKSPKPLPTPPSEPPASASIAIDTLPSPTVTFAATLTDTPISPRAVSARDRPLPTISSSSTSTSPTSPPLIRAVTLPSITATTTTPTKSPSPPASARSFKPRPKYSPELGSRTLPALPTSVVPSLSSTSTSSEAAASNSITASSSPPSIMSRIRAFTNLGNSTPRDKSNATSPREEAITPTGATRHFVVRKSTVGTSPRDASPSTSSSASSPRSTALSSADNAAVTPLSRSLSSPRPPPGRPPATSSSTRPALNSPRSLNALNSMHEGDEMDDQLDLHSPKHD